MNWGKGITIAMILFIGFIVYLATIMMTRKVDLESEDYYVREIAYEQEIDALKNANERQSVIVSKEGAYLVVKVPDSLDYMDVQLNLLRPNNDELDKVYDIKGTKTFTLSLDDLEKGNYRYEISYKHEGEPCLQKGKIVI
jgi:hypothetical protein